MIVNKKIILVEDDEATREGYAEILRDTGFHVDAFGDRDTALTQCKLSLPDLAILDVTLHGERDAGFELCKQLRNLAPTLPIIFLTSHDSDIDRISGLRLGADDYLVKTVSLDYLVVRIETLLRRADVWANYAQAGATSERRTIVLGSLELEPEQLRAFWQGQPVDLNLTQFWMVKALVEEPGRLKTFSELMSAANIVVEPNTVVAHVKHIRDRFLRVDNSFDRIKNERGRGYRWLTD